MDGIRWLMLLPAMVVRDEEDGVHSVVVVVEDGDVVDHVAEEVVGAVDPVDVVVVGAERTKRSGCRSQNWDDW
jgi:hypothetical protein